MKPNREAVILLVIGIGLIIVSLFADTIRTVRGLTLACAGWPYERHGVRARFTDLLTQTGILLGQQLACGDVLNDQQALA